MSLTADLLQACLEHRIDSMDGLIAVIERLDHQGLVDWAEPLIEGQPLLHRLLHSGYRQNQFVEHTVRRKPELLLSTDQHGVSLWEEAWNRAAHSSTRATLIMFIGMAPEAAFGPPEMRTALMQRALKVDETNLVQALDKRLNHQVTFSTEDTQALYGRLTAGNWPAALRQAGRVDALVKGPVGGERPLWRVAHDQKLVSPVKQALREAALPPAQAAEAGAWLDMADAILFNRHQTKPTIASIKTIDQELKEADLEEGLGTRDDLGRPAAWHLLMQSPHLMKEMENTKTGRAWLRMTDHADHTVGFYVFPHLGAVEFTRQDKAYFKEHMLRHVFTLPVNGRGLLAQHYADPEAPFYRVWGGGTKLPSVAALDQGSGPSHDFMTTVFSSAGVWAMREGDAERMVATWLTSPKILPDLVVFLNKVLDNPTTRECMMATPLEPYVPVLRAFSGLYAGLFQKSNIPQGMTGGRSWQGTMAAEWPALPVSEGALQAMIQHAKSTLDQSTTTEKNLAALAEPENTFFAKLRAQRILQEAPPEQPRRRMRPRT